MRLKSWFWSSPRILFCWFYWECWRKSSCFQVRRFGLELLSGRQRFQGYNPNADPSLPTRWPRRRCGSVTAPSGTGSAGLAGSSATSPTLTWGSSIIPNSCMTWRMAESTPYCGVWPLTGLRILMGMCEAFEMWSAVWRGFTLLYSSLLYSTPLHSTPLHSTPLHSTPLHSTPLHSTPLHSAPLRSAPLHSTPLHSTPLHSTPLHSTPLHSTPLHSTPPHPTPPAPQPHPTPSTATATPPHRCNLLHPKLTSLQFNWRHFILTWFISHPISVPLMSSYPLLSSFV